MAVLALVSSAGRLMVMDRRVIGIAVALLAGAACGGYALGGYATGGGQAAIPVENDGSADLWRDEGAAPVAPPPSPVQASVGPERYVCHGCGPTLAERRAQAAWGGGSPDAGYGAPENIYPQSGL